MNARLTRRAVLGSVVGNLAVWMLGAAATSAWSAPATPASCAVPTSTELTNFFDSAVPGRLADNHVPGAAISVVSGNQTVFAKGYGLADTGHGIPFDPARSLVRIASITKLFTWTAVMQQVEAGTLDLNVDVNRYLTAFKIPATYPQPVTLQELMNHTAGFEDEVIGSGARTAADVPPQGDYLASHMPARIRPPGQIAAYSNYGAALAGYIVSQVSGEPYDHYIRSHLLDPLGMAHSTATEPVPAALVGDQARSYNSDDNPPRPVPFTFDPMPGDGAISTTATDMANFMNAYLNDGRFGDRAILSPASVAQMWQRSYAADPRLAGYAHGFMDKSMNGHRVLMHDGSWEAFESVLILVPGCHIGLFVTTNATGGIDAVGPLLQAFFDRFAPTPAVPDAVPASPASPLKVATPRAGFYEPTRHNESTVEKVVNLLGPARLSIDPDGTVHFKGRVWTPDGNGLYARADGRDHLVFLTAPDGQRYVATDGPAYQLMTAQESLVPVNMVVLIGFAVAAASALAVPLTPLWRRVFRRTATISARWRLARSLAAGSTGLGLVFLVLLAVQILGDTSDFLYGQPLSFRLFLLLPLVIFAMTGTAAVYSVVGWRRSGAGVTGRVHQVVLFAGLVGLTWFLWQWNLFWPIS